MTDARIVPATVDHIAPIALRARPADVRELWAQARQSPADTMARGLDVGAATWTGLLHGVPVCMFGVTAYSVLLGQGIPWMVGTTDLDHLSAQKALLRCSHEALRKMERLFPELLFNMVDERNDAAKRWLTWLGFTFLDPIPFGVDQMPFRPFFRKAAPHV